MILGSTLGPPHPRKPKWDQISNPPWRLFSPDALQDEEASTGPRRFMKVYLPSGPELIIYRHQKLTAVETDYDPDCERGAK